MTHCAHLDPIDIFMWRRIDRLITTSGQPSAQQLRQISALGVTHVVNLGLHSHERALPDEANLVASLGMTYIHLPVDFTDPTDADYARFCEVMGGLSGRAIHVHCIANLRVSAFCYRYRRDELRVPEELARREMDTIWRPGGAWARIVGDETAQARGHLYAGRDY